MNKLTRRDFVKGSLAVGAAMMLPGCAGMQTPFRRVRGANEEIRVAVVGFRKKGAQHVRVFRQLPGVRVAALCDVDRGILNREVKKFKDRNEKVDAYIDIRRVLDDKNIDAVVIATPNHWHSLITVWACQAGKDVYVEKPISHNVWEGRQVVEAAHKYKRIVQAGIQKRSDKGLASALEYLRRGNLGKILVARGFCYKRRKSIGRVDGPQSIPESVDYNLWTGPAHLTPLMRKRLHYDWHWVWPTGNGDLGNRGVHELDICRWALGERALAPRVMSIGGRFGYVDDGRTPNTQIVIFDYKPAPIIFEVRGLAQKKDDPVMDTYRGIRIGVVIQCEGGYFAGGGGGGWLYDNDGKKIKQFIGDGGAGHQANFIKALRSRKVSDLNADIIEGHISSALCHIGNISHRIGQLSSPDEIREAIRAESEAVETFERFEEHLTANQIDLSKNRAILGSWLKINSRKEKFIGSGRFGITKWANELLRRDYREPFVVPEKV